jgi:preprotein translocase subunit SecY
LSIFASIGKVPELRRRILFTVGMLAVYRIGIFVTTPGVDRNVMKSIVADQSATFLGMVNMFSGGAFEQLSIFALGIMPYVSASIILQLMSVVIKPLEEMRKEGEAGQRKINQYTRYGTVVISIVQSTGLALYFEGLNGTTQYGDVVRDPGWGFRLMTVISLTTGTAFIMWLGEQIGERGIGNGTSMIIFAGICADLPDALFRTLSLLKTSESLQPVGLLIVTGICLGLVWLICRVERAQRRIPIHYARRMVGRKMYGGQTSHLPLRVNMAGVIAPIFASSLLIFPSTLQRMNLPGMQWVANALSPGGWGYLAVFVVMIVFFSFFYTSVTFQPVEVADNLKKQSAFIPGVRPGKSTADYIDRIAMRLTAGGALYVAFVCTVPSLLQSAFHVPFNSGGTSIMIVVGVALDTVQQVESYLITRHYEGLTGPRGARIRARKG